MTSFADGRWGERLRLLRVLKLLHWLLHRLLVLLRLRCLLASGVVRIRR